jgi:carbamoyltransferase
MGTELDLLVVGDCVLWKEQQDKSLIEDYKEKYELD